jgi:TatD DNase family protein
MRLFDTHAHLNMESFEDDRDAVIRRAEEIGLIGIVDVGTDVPTKWGVYALDLLFGDPAVFSQAAGWIRSRIESLITAPDFKFLKILLIS